MTSDSAMPPEGSRDAFGMVNAMPVEAVTIRNVNGLSARLISYGARLVEFWAPDRDGTFADVVLGWDTLGDYVSNRGCLGATCGRYANRISGGKFSLNNKTVQLDLNEGPNQLHGGPIGFDKRVWDIVTNDDHSVLFRLHSVDGDQGYRGDLVAEVTYALRDDDVLEIAIEAKCDQDTIVNIVNHAYWTMGGHQSGDVLNQFMKINASHYLPVDEEKIPTGAIESVDGGAFDFRMSHAVGDKITEAPGGYYDHNFCLDGARGELTEALVLEDRMSGRRMTLSTTEPGVQVYTAAHLNGSDVGKAGVFYPRAAGIAIETQNWPDAPNHPAFPDPVMNAGETYSHIMEFKFSADA